MRKICFAVFFSCLFFTAFSQKYSFNIQAGGNTSFIPKFDNTITFMSGGLLIPDLFEIDNTGNRFVGSNTNETTPKNLVSFFADAQLERQLKNGWGLSASLGVNQIKYTYDNALYEYNSQTPFITESRSMKKDVHNEYGDTKLTYITSRVANISKQWNRFAITAGPELNYLLSKKYYNQFTQRSSSGSEQYIIVYSDGRGNAQKLLIGATFAARYEIAKRLYISLGGQKILNSLYRKEGTADDVHKKSKPLQIELGVGYGLMHF